jgi:rhodanese-related sulfurtransferase
MKKHFLLSVAVAFFVSLTFCAPMALAKDMTAQDLVGEAKKNICEVSVSEAKALLDKGGYIFLDCREPKEFKMGHVPGAMNIPRGLLEFKIGKKVSDKNANIVMYCKKGGRGCLATCTLCRMGYKNVKNMAGGWKAWEKAEYPVE